MKQPTSAALTAGAHAAAGAPLRFKPDIVTTHVGKIADAVGQPGTNSTVT
jgi:hypothetical protein